jgi:hypothetical protein
MRGSREASLRDARSRRIASVLFCFCFLFFVGMYLLRACVGMAGILVYIRLLCGFKTAPLVHAHHQYPPTPPPSLSLSPSPSRTCGGRLGLARATTAGVGRCGDEEAVRNA